VSEPSSFTARALRELRNLPVPAYIIGGLVAIAFVTFFGVLDLPVTVNAVAYLAGAGGHARFIATGLSTNCSWDGTTTTCSTVTLGYLEPGHLLGGRLRRHPAGTGRDHRIRGLPLGTGTAVCKEAPAGRPARPDAPPGAGRSRRRCDGIISPASSYGAGRAKPCQGNRAGKTTCSSTRAGTLSNASTLNASTCTLALTAS
jgi:hypothetical protein